MKKLGLVGGTGPLSTIEYYKEINRLVNEKTNGEQFPELTVDSVDLYALLRMVEAEKYDEACEYLGTSVKRLAGCGADYVAFTAITCHILFPQVAAICPVPMISIPETTAEYIKEKGYQKVGLLGTIFTMEHDYLSGPITMRGIEVVVPPEKERLLISNYIYSELELGIIKPETVAELVAVIERMKAEDGIEAIILGCTELPLVLNDSISPVPCIDTVKIHIDKLVRLIIEDHLPTMKPLE